MPEWIWIVAGTTAILAIVVCIAWRPMRGARRSAQYERARKEFHQQRERLEAKFVQLASTSGKPRGLRWTACEFDDDVAYARDRHSGELCALVAVTIGFEAIEGGLMEGVEAVGNLRAATAVFRVERGRWQTDGRAIFNLNPTEAIAYYQDNLEIVGQEVAHRSW
ncbi:MAG: hypothetical protein WD847_07050 [Pirellulales bacterium]